MIRKLELKNFKNFQAAELPLGPFTILIGANASGKSNLRDAFRFLHGVSRGYTLAEIIGEKYGEWSGIRGGIREIAYQNAPSFRLTVEFNLNDSQFSPPTGVYCIEIQPQGLGGRPYLLHEGLFHGDQTLFEIKRNVDRSSDRAVYLREGEKPALDVAAGAYSERPQLPTVAAASMYRLSDPAGVETYRPVEFKPVTEAAQKLIGILKSMRFIDLELPAMRQPSTPGQTLLGDHCENLSSVLHTICENPQRKSILLEWVQELTPMDAVDLEFPAEQTGKVLVTLVEASGQKVSAHSASDGTLRFLAYLAALLSPAASAFYFFEELENGIHPTRLHLLLDLIERTTRQKNIQIVATTHSPQLLGLIDSRTKSHAALTYRLPQQPDAHVQRIFDLPEKARQVLEQDHLNRLFESGWFEDAMYFLDEDTE